VAVERRRLVAVAAVAVPNSIDRCEERDAAIIETQRHKEKNR
jgi:hypothetical protein